MTRLQLLSACPWLSSALVVTLSVCGAQAEVVADAEEVAAAGSPNPYNPHAEEQAEQPALLPLELTAFGDIRYLIAKTAPDDFQIGSVELDAALELARPVMVSAALVYKPDSDSFGLGAFTVDGSLLGPEKKHLVRADWLLDSGIVFGQFDVPFGIAYLRYASLDNPFVLGSTLVDRAHGGWNDIGMQAYAIAEHFDLTTYLVNGTALPDVSADGEAAPSAAFGGRVGVKPMPEVAVGVSLASTTGQAHNGLLGADLSAHAGPFEMQNEYIWRDAAASGVVHGLYSQVLLHHDILCAGARWESVFTDEPAVGERAFGLTLGATVFPSAEIRIAHLHGMQTETHSTFIQLVGGSVWQPTGLRR